MRPYRLPIIGSGPCGDVAAAWARNFGHSSGGSDETRNPRIDTPEMRQTLWAADESICRPRVKLTGAADRLSIGRG